MIVAIVIVVMVLILAVPFAVSRWKHRQVMQDLQQRSELHWQSVGVPPPLLNEALSIIRFEATRTFGEAVLDLPWGGFIEWTISSPSKVEPRLDPSSIYKSGKLPIFTIRWEPRIEDTALVPALVLWIAAQLRARSKDHTEPLRVAPLNMLAARLRSDMAVQFNRDAYVVEPTLPADAPPPRAP
jgi:hypothetical protein